MPHPFPHEIRSNNMCLLLLRSQKNSLSAGPSPTPPRSYAKSPGVPHLWCCSTLASPMAVLNPWWISKKIANISWDFMGLHRSYKWKNHNLRKNLGFNMGDIFVEEPSGYQLGISLEYMSGWESPENVRPFGDDSSCFTMIPVGYNTISCPNFPCVGGPEKSTLKRIGDLKLLR